MEDYIRTSYQSNSATKLSKNFVSSIILAAGFSSRMSLGNKLLLKNKNSVPLLQETLENVIASKTSEVIVVTGHNHSKISEVLKTKECKIILNKNYKNGISNSIAAGVKALNKKSQGVMICLGDMPNISTDTYNTLIESFFSSKKKAIVVPYYKKRQANPIIFDSFFFKRLLKVSGDDGAKYLLHENQEHINAIKIQDPGVKEDIDNKKDYLSYMEKNN